MCSRPPKPFGADCRSLLAGDPVASAKAGVPRRYARHRESRVASPAIRSRRLSFCHARFPFSHAPDHRIRSNLRRPACDRGRDRRGRQHHRSHHEIIQPIRRHLYDCRREIRVRTSVQRCHRHGQRPRAAHGRRVAGAPFSRAIPRRPPAGHRTRLQQCLLGQPCGRRLFLRLQRNAVVRQP